MNEVYEKLDKLKLYLRTLGSVAVSFSGGVDSTFLLKVAHDELGENAVAVTAISHSFPEREKNEAISFCSENKINQYFVISDELNIPGFRNNPKNRCYLCKKELFSKIIQFAKENGISYICEGSNMDDSGDYRPGFQAITELGIKSPLREVGLSKNEIRFLSKEMNLPTWNKPSFACLASRFAYGEEISEEKLLMVEKAEQFLMDLGFLQFRVRLHGGNLARIEVLPEQIELILKNREKIAEELRKIGFAYVSLDLEGYRMGSMNRVLKS